MTIRVKLVINRITAGRNESAVKKSSVCIGIEYVCAPPGPGWLVTWIGVIWPTTSGAINTAVRHATARMAGMLRIRWRAACMVGTSSRLKACEDSTERCRSRRHRSSGWLSLINMCCLRRHVKRGDLRSSDADDHPCIAKLNNHDSFTRSDRDRRDRLQQACAARSSRRKPL